MAMLKHSDTSSSKEYRHPLSSLWNVIFESCQEWMSFKPSLGLCVYPCYACRHMFSSKSALQDHVNRRILVLKYNCPECPNEVLTFYNRCSFLLHARNHYNLEQGQINLCEVEIFPLPVQLAGFLPNTSIPLVYPEEEESANDININTKFYSAHISQKGQPRIVLTSDEVLLRQNSTALTLKQVCKNIPKCELIPVERQTMLVKNNFHKQENVDSGVDQPRIKMDTDRYTNEVTMPFISKIESLQEKLIRLPRCLECNTFQFHTMAGHYQGENKPNDMTLSCSVCKFVASTKCSLLAHTRIHNNTPPYVCPDCGKNFGAPESLTQHINAVCFHLAKIVRFKCPGKKCGKLFATIATFTNHLKTHLNCVITCSFCSTIFFTIEDAKDHLKTHEEACNFLKIYNCSVCRGMGTLDEFSYTKHLEDHTNDTERCVYVYICKGCRSYFRSTTTYASHLLKCFDKSDSSTKMRNTSQKYGYTQNCDQCQDIVSCNTDNPTALCNTCKQLHEIKSKVLSKRYFCVLCSKQIKLKEKLMHLRVCMYAQPIVILENLDGKMISKLINWHSQYSNSSKVDENNKKKRKRCHSTKCHKNKNVGKEMETELIAEEPTLFNGIYNCKLCAYGNEKRSKFHDHIKNHRNISTAYQCMECGECFVVKPSLIKHLMHFHNIFDFHTYLKQNDSYDAKAAEEAQNTSSTSWQAKDTVKENQCRVCLQEFTDALLLNNHFRIHGMAYLMNNK